MSKLSGTVTSTPEEKWGLMAEDADAGAAEADTPATTVDISKANTSTVVVEKPTADEIAEDKAPKTKAPKDKTPTGNVGDEDVTDESGKDTDGRSWRRVFTIRRIAVGALAVVAIAAIVVAAILGWKLNEQNNIDAAADEARAAAEQYAVTLTSVSSDSLDQNFAAVLDGATGEFKDMYSQSSGQLRDLLVENKANAQGTVIDSGIKSATTSKVEVMLFVDQSVTNTATPDARIDRSRVLMTMEKIDGRWLAAKVDLP